MSVPIKPPLVASGKSLSAGNLNGLSAPPLQVDAARVSVVASVARNDAIMEELAQAERVSKTAPRRRG